MKAVRIHTHGNRSVLLCDDIKRPSCESDKVLLEVKSASINHLDVWVRGGLPGLSIPLPLIMGSDASGIIVEVGQDVEGWKVGDEVVVQPGTCCGECEFCSIGKENYCPHYGILGETANGVQAEIVVLSPKNLYYKAAHLSFEEAASMPLVFMTAYQMLITRAQLQSNETILVYGGSSGVGSAAIQIAKDRGATVIATVGSDEKSKHALKMGADYIVNHYEDDWQKSVKSIVGKQGVNVIFEHVGPATWPYSMRLLGKGGRVVTCGATTGPKVNIDLTHLFMKQQTILGSTMSDISTYKAVMDKINSGVFTPFVDKVFSFDDIQSAHERIENGDHIGKIVLVP
ncbi:MAG: zinc-binding dehydrogenase [Candidatus Marinimicrobia bacterium]|nr:zinc-binding dehydrogenase [Candidatus Neomarinimicrobiota bacterium]MBT7378145.1 zinc-binding dehydrogenase [Candidatus Neomarinimicrobiota bacterium]